jgi:Domain of unknown function (DUF5106)/Thioredoxin-like
MKKLLLIGLFLVQALFGFAQKRIPGQVKKEVGYDLKIVLKPYKNQYIYLGYYYGKIKALADSALLDGNCQGAFKGKQRLNGGIYFVVSPRKEILFEVLIDKQQQFTIEADSAGLPLSVRFGGSPENTLFQNYTRFTAVKGKTLTDLYAQYANARNSSDSARIGTELRFYNQQLLDYRDSLANKNPTTLLAALFRALKEPVVPSAEKHPGGRYDSLYALNYFKTNYWKGISFTDERLLRTPIFEQRLDKYYKDLVVPHPDTISREADQMLLHSRPNKEMFKYLLTYLVQKYIKPEYMGLDAVFVHLFEKYINNNPQVDWFTEAYRKYMFERAYSLMANLIGNPAQNLELVDTQDTPRPLYGIEAPFTVICFWDPTCSHCKEVVPKVDSLFQNKWKQKGIVVYGVMVDGGKEAWIKYIKENNLSGWVHVYQTAAQKDSENKAGKASYKQLYDVYQTPVLYLLDKEKRIIAKKLTYEQIDEVLKLKMKSGS